MNGGHRTWILTTTMPTYWRSLWPVETRDMVLCATCYITSSIPMHRRLEGVDGRVFWPTNHYDVWIRPCEPNHKCDYDVWTRPWEPNHKCLFYVLFLFFWRPWTKHESEPWMQFTVKPSSPQWWWLEGSVSVYTYRNMCVTYGRMCVTCEWTCVSHEDGGSMPRITAPLDQQRPCWHRLYRLLALENMPRARLVFDLVL